MNCSNYSNVNKEDHNFCENCETKTNCDGKEDSIKKGDSLKNNGNTKSELKASNEVFEEQRIGNTGKESKRTDLKNKIRRYIFSRKFLILSAIIICIFGIIKLGISTSNISISYLMAHIKSSGAFSQVESNASQLPVPSNLSSIYGKISSEDQEKTPDEGADEGADSKLLMQIIEFKNDDDAKIYNDYANELTKNCRNRIADKLGVPDNELENIVDTSRLFTEGKQYGVYELQYFFKPGKIENIDIIQSILEENIKSKKSNYTKENYDNVVSLFEKYFDDKENSVVNETNSNIESFENEKLNTVLSYIDKENEITEYNYSFEYDIWKNNLDFLEKIMDNPKYSDKYEILKNKIQPILDNCNVFADQKREIINQLFKTAEETYSESDLEELESKLAEIKDLKIYGADYDNWSKKYDELSNTIKVKAEEQRKAEEEQRKAKQAEIDNASLEQKNALRTAKSYLNTMSFSRSGLIEQLEYEQYSSEAAVWAVDHVEADWNEQAAKKAKEYLDMMAFSRRGLIDQLKFEGFTEEEAEYGATSVGY